MKIQLKEKQNLFFRIALAAALVFVIVSALQVKSERDIGYDKLEELEIRIVNQQRINDELLEKTAGDGTYLEQLLEQQAHNKGYYRPGEIVYKEVPGN